MIQRSPHTTFLRVFADRCRSAFPDYEVVLFGSTPESRDSCPRMTIDFLGSEGETLTVTRGRRKRSAMQINIRWFKWFDLEEADNPPEDAKLEWVAEYDHNQARILDVLSDLLNNGVGDGVALHKVVPIVGITWELPANARSAMVASGATLKNLPIDYTTREEP